jgi:hypothetical protein
VSQVIDILYKIKKPGAENGKNGLFGCGNETPAPQTKKPGPFGPGIVDAAWTAPSWSSFT